MPYVPGEVPDIPSSTRKRLGSLFIGVDVHKDTHTAVGVSALGERLFEVKIGNDDRAFKKLTETVSEKRGVLSPFYGLEDCHGYGERLAEYLSLAGHRVIHVPSILVDCARQNATHPEKSDSLDALGVAEVMIRKIDTLPVYTLSEDSKRAKQIKEISLDREYLVTERTRLKNHLHVLLHRVWNTGYREKFKDPFSMKALKYWGQSRISCDDFLRRMLRRKVRRLLAINAEVRDLEKELTTLLDESGYTIQTASGCGPVVAAVIVGEVGDIARFHSPGALAKYAGCAPRELSSGKHQRHVKTRARNRRLNSAFHQMAVSQISRMGNDKAREYFRKKVSEGKSKSQALVCLRRHLVNVIWCMMSRREVYRTA